MLAALQKYQYAILAFAILGFVAAILGRAIIDRPGSRIEFATDPSLGDGAPISVHVAGAVVRPGVYSLKAGDRADDALAAAGGPAESADLDAVNLARRLRDGDQVYFPAMDGARTAAPVAGKPVDLNTASAEALNALP